jgi:hypothetical protein
MLTIFQCKEVALSIVLMSCGDAQVSASPLGASTQHTRHEHVVRRPPAAAGQLPPPTSHQAQSSERISGVCHVQQPKSWWLQSAGTSEPRCAGTCSDRSAQRTTAPNRTIMPTVLGIAVTTQPPFCLWHIQGSAIVL